MTSASDSSNTRLHWIFFAALVLLFLPTWRWLGEAWLTDPYYSHGPLVLLVALYLAWNTRRTLAPRVPNRWGWAVVGLALAVHLVAVVWQAFYLSALMFPPALAGLVVTVSGWQATRRWAFPLAFLLLMVPLPLAQVLGPWLEGWTASTAIWLAQALGIAASDTGSPVNLTNSTLTAGIPCAGLRSAIAIMTLAALLVFIVRGARWARTAIFLAAIPVALAANLLRLTLLFAIASVWGTQAGLDNYAWLSPVLFLAAFALLLLLTRALRCSQVRWEVVFPQ